MSPSPDRWLDLNGWSTPATSYPIWNLKQKHGPVGSFHGSARVVRRFYKGAYQAYGIHDVGIVYFARRAPITCLEIGPGKTWMVDDPPHWWSIQDTAKCLKGRVLVGGLGLGLIVWAMQDNPNVKEIVVVEQSPDVISLIEPLLPRRIPLSIVQEDIWEYVERREQFDTAFIDIWVTSGLGQGMKTFNEQVLPLSIRTWSCTGAPMYSLGFVRSEPLPPWAKPRLDSKIVKEILPSLDPAERSLEAWNRVIFPRGEELKDG